MVRVGQIVSVLWIPFQQKHFALGHSLYGSYYLNLSGVYCYQGKHTIDESSNKSSSSPLKHNDMCLFLEEIANNLLILSNSFRSLSLSNFTESISNFAAASSTLLVMTSLWGNGESRMSIGNWFLLPTTRLLVVVVALVCRDFSNSTWNYTKTENLCVMLKMFWAYYTTLKLIFWWVSITFFHSKL